MKLADLKYSEQLPERFWGKVDVRSPDDCWEWQTGTRNGYGAIGVVMRQRGKRPSYAHRIAYMLTHGEVDDALLVRHECDNPLCVNPRHLLLGTKKDNADDAVARGLLNNRGEHNGNAKLCANQVHRIWQLIQEGTSDLKIARQFGVSASTIWRIRHRRQWTHVRPDDDAMVPDMQLA